MNMEKFILWVSPGVTIILVFMTASKFSGCLWHCAPYYTLLTNCQSRHPLGSPTFGELET